jgi:peptidyl-prolyl cis-trans isomerase B (cyclophilin B)
MFMTRIRWRCSWLLGGVLALGTAGCGGSTPAVATGGGTEEAAAVPTSGAPIERYRQPFEQAAITDAIPDGQHLPPDRTAAGKPTGPLRVAVEALWPQIVLADTAGKPKALVGTVETDAGAFEIALRPELAPNHVRNFIALAKAGYYEGLWFDRIVHQESMTEDGHKVQLDLVKAGCPLGSGDDGVGHIGYFLKPEFSSDVHHEEGTVGFWHDDDPTSAGCHLYITLGPAPALDGEFTIIGQVTRGLDVVRKIAASPVQLAEVYPEREKPAAPTLLRRVTIAPEPLEKPGPRAAHP